MLFLFSNKDASKSGWEHGTWNIQTSASTLEELPWDSVSSKSLLKDVIDVHADLRGLVELDWYLSNFLSNFKGSHLKVKTESSENFALKYHREIMEGHWSNDSVSIFTAVVYYKDNHSDELKHLSYVIISDELRYDKANVHMCNQALLEAVSPVLSFKKVHYFSDGAGSQFKY